MTKQLECILGGEIFGSKCPYRGSQHLYDFADSCKYSARCIAASLPEHVRRAFLEPQVEPLDANFTVGSDSQVITLSIYDPHTRESLRRAISPLQAIKLCADLLEVTSLKLGAHKR